jgi:hypothetical protein
VLTGGGPLFSELLSSVGGDLRRPTASRTGGEEIDVGTGREKANRASGSSPPTQG